MDKLAMKDISGRDIDSGLLLQDCIDHLVECDELETAQEEFGDLNDIDWFDLLILAHDCGIDPMSYKYIKGRKQLDRRFEQ